MGKRVVDLRSQKPLLDVVSYGRRAPGQRRTFTPAERAQIGRTVARTPEVMIKVLPVGANSVKSVAHHLRYIDRYGELEIETDDGERLKGDRVERELLADWGLELQEREATTPYSGAPGRKGGRLVHKIVFSMPAGTPPQKLLAAVRLFAQEKFALQHRYAMVLHTDQAHPHVHLVLKAVSERGVRLNIHKVTLREWRRDFAAALREQGVPANATERAVRGESRGHKKDGILRAMRRGASKHFEERIMTVARELRAGQRDTGPGKARLMATRRNIERGWQSVSELLDREGDSQLARLVKRFVDEMPPPQTEREWIACEVARRVGLGARDRPARTR